MDLALSVLSRVLPFFLLVGAGGAMARLRLLDDGMARGLSAYVFWIGFPALLIHALSRIDVTDAALLRGLMAFALAALAVMAGLAILGLILGWTREERAGAALAGGLGNSAFLGLPVAAAVLGPEAARLAAGVVAVDFVLVAATGIALLGWASGRSVGHSVLQALSNPIVAASLIGVVMALTGLRLPDLLDRAIAATAVSGSPVALVTLGAALVLSGDQTRPAPAWGPILSATAAKLVILPVLTWILVGLADAPTAFRLGATLLAATPTAVNVFIQTRTLGVFERGAARTVALTTALACITLSGVAMLLTRAVS
ncbi:MULTISPECIES: AEC family transporter [unclassified Caulobacter]|uniref:AEC family transporter n=1 Tax=unclassified Caulobacter TaxID=2648921 RepID=UPI000D391A30|nr:MULTISPECIES: AEC family transporter [unclassified Caulobacter]PTS84568.1 transporter [Caulobacter sp. HMWF009]PTT08657.1 transporter [Caulobacter sp. HMWF025]PTT75612.1 transporter [Pseudomonas sp. HMWF010]